MKIPISYKITSKIASLLATVEANKELISSLNIPVAIEENIRRQSMLGSSLFSARIEGNTLTQTEVSSFRDITSKEQKKLEISNLLKAIELILSKYRKNKSLTIKNILQLHTIAMQNILNGKYVGLFRPGHEGVFDVSGNLIYHAPPPNQVPDLVEKIIDFSNSDIEPLIPIRATLSHLMFERVHPFVNGSGRVGRLLQLAVLVKNDYAMKGTVIVEEEIDKNRSLYYQAIEDSVTGDATEFVEVMLEFLADASTKAKKKLLESIKYTDIDLLPPRRKEIVEIIRDHRMISLDFLCRRFLKVDPRLLRYDLKSLMDSGYISKIGKTRGALYAPKE